MSDKNYKYLWVSTPRMNVSFLQKELVIETFLALPSLHMLRENNTFFDSCIFKIFMSRLQRQIMLDVA